MRTTPKDSHNARRIRKAPFAVLTFFLLLWLIGVATGEPGRVMEQAIQVCLSCIGIG
ncbi:CD1871A family CXXC motif-containing protein [Thiovibrio sp. JS02]